jgi:hypothetical protein
MGVSEADVAVAAGLRMTVQSVTSSHTEHAVWARHSLESTYAMLDVPYADWQTIRSLPSDVAAGCVVRPATWNEVVS